MRNFYNFPFGKRLRDRLKAFFPSSQPYFMLIATKSNAQQHKG
jgi:hypothetical protein